MSNGVKWGSRGLLLEFWDPLISRRWLKLATSNLAFRRMAVSSDGKCKISPKGVMCGHVTHFWNYRTPLISLDRLKLETSNLGRRETIAIYDEKMQN